MARRPQVVPDNYQYSRLALAIKDKSTLGEEKLAELTEITGATRHIHAVLLATLSLHPCPTCGSDLCYVFAPSSASL